MNHHQIVPEETDEDCESEEYKTILYATVHDEIQVVLNLSKIPIKCKGKLKYGSKKTPVKNEFKVHSNMAEVYGKVTLSMTKKLRNWIITSVKSCCM